MAIIELWKSILVTMATVAMVTEFKGLKVHLHAKFRCDQAINTKDRNATDRQIDDMYINILFLCYKQPVLIYKAKSNNVGKTDEDLMWWP